MAQDILHPKLILEIIENQYICLSKLHTHTLTITPNVDYKNQTTLRLDAGLKGGTKATTTSLWVTLEVGTGICSPRCL